MTPLNGGETAERLKGLHSASAGGVLVVVQSSGLVPKLSAPGGFRSEGEGWLAPKCDHGVWDMRYVVANMWCRVWVMQCGVCCCASCDPYGPSSAGIHCSFN